MKYHFIEIYLNLRSMCWWLVSFFDALNLRIFFILLNTVTVSPASHSLIYAIDFYFIFMLYFDFDTPSYSSGWISCFFYTLFYRHKDFLVRKLSDYDLLLGCYLSMSLRIYLWSQFFATTKKYCKTEVFYLWWKNDDLKWDNNSMDVIRKKEPWPKFLDNPI